MHNLIRDPHFLKLAYLLVKLFNFALNHFFTEFGAHLVVLNIGLKEEQPFKIMPLLVSECQEVCRCQDFEHSVICHFNLAIIVRNLVHDSIDYRYLVRGVIFVCLHLLLGLIREVDKV